jgi:hypothetical protein
VDLDNGNSLDIQVNVEHVALNFAPLYFRWIGNISGQLNGVDLMSNRVVLFEGFHLSGLRLGGIRHRTREVKLWLIAVSIVHSHR